VQSSLLTLYCLNTTADELVIRWCACRSRCAIDIISPTTPPFFLTFPVSGMRGIIFRFVRAPVYQPPCSCPYPALSLFLFRLPVVLTDWGLHQYPSYSAQCPTTFTELRLDLRVKSMAFFYVLVVRIRGSLFFHRDEADGSEAYHRSRQQMEYPDSIGIDTLHAGQRCASSKVSVTLPTRQCMDWGPRRGAVSFHVDGRFLQDVRPAVEPVEVQRIRSMYV
jgi:hypothetical protein